MGYSVKQDSNNSKVPSAILNVFSKEEWDRYPFAKKANLKWFEDARFGLFLHVGISAMGKVDISWSRTTHILPDMPYWGKTVPDDVYDNWANLIKFENFDAKEWAKLAVDAGFKYVVIISKHHDGFHMWDTEFSEYKITNSPMGRDYLREVIDAFRAEGLKIGIYYSKRDWVHPDYQPVCEDDAVAIKSPPFFKMKEGKTHIITQKHKKYLQYMFDTVRELMTNYGKIDLLWWDAEWNLGMFTKEMWDSENLEKMVRELQPDIIIDNRAGLPGDFDTPEGNVGFFQNNRPWETCMPLGAHWSHTGKSVKPVKTILSQLLNCAGGDGNYLLSIGCKADGSIAEDEKAKLLQIGAWLKKYGTTIYGTRGGVWKPNRRFASTHKGNIIYLHILKSSPFTKIRVPLKNNTLIEVECLTGERLKIKRVGEYLQLRVKGRKRSTADVIAKFSVAGKARLEF